jgi:hypothetical protein
MFDGVRNGVPVSGSEVGADAGIRGSRLLTRAPPDLTAGAETPDELVFMIVGLAVGD